MTAKHFQASVNMTLFIRMGDNTEKKQWKKNMFKFFLGTNYPRKK